MSTIANTPPRRGLRPTDAYDKASLALLHIRLATRLLMDDHYNDDPDIPQWLFGTIMDNAEAANAALNVLDPYRGREDR